MTRVTGLFVYPVKSLRGYAVAAADVDALGFVGDRRFVVVDETGKFLTQRTVPAMARIGARLADGSLTLAANGAGNVAVSCSSDPAAAALIVSIWKSSGLIAEDCGEPVATWLSDFLGVKCRLARVGQKFSRPMLKAAAQSGDAVAATDAYPLLAISEASLAALNDRIQEHGGDPVPMDRFRPNLVVADCAPFAEDRWTRVQVGNVTLRQGGPCARCIVTTTDQSSGERLGKEPLRTLATFRRDATDPTDVNFGANLIHETKVGTLRVGDLVTPL